MRAFRNLARKTKMFRRKYLGNVIRKGYGLLRNDLFYLNIALILPQVRFTPETL
jgi:hypothetical protein